MMPITQSDIAQLQARLDAGDRPGFYIQYYNLTGNQQALVQAIVSSYSGLIGGQALFANSAVISYLTLFGRRDAYPVSTDAFSLEIAADLFNKIKTDVLTGGAGVFTDSQIMQFAKDQWIAKGIGDCFPGNEITGTPAACSFIANVLGANVLSATLTAVSQLPALALPPITSPAVPPGGQTITTPDGKVTYIIDSSGNVVQGSVQSSTQVFPALQFNEVVNGNQISLDTTWAATEGTERLAGTFYTTEVNGNTVVVGQDLTLTTP